MISIIFLVFVLTHKRRIYFYWNFHIEKNPIQAFILPIENIASIFKIKIRRQNFLAVYQEWKNWIYKRKRENMTSIWYITVKTLKYNSLNGRDGQNPENEYSNETAIVREIAHFNRYWSIFLSILTRWKFIMVV